MAQSLNALFIMADQMRADCMSCAGHPVLRTPNLDALAREGTRFTNAFVQSAVCGPSRMCYYTGRYVHNHRSNWNDVPLSRDERTMGHLLAEAGYRTVNCGKDHYVADPRGGGKPLADWVGTLWPWMTTLAGMEDYVLMDVGRECPEYVAFLREQGYPDEVVADPYLVNGANGPERWNWTTGVKGSVIRAEHSETAWLTDRALDFIRQPGHKPWMMHLSYLRPHQPTTPPEPYNALYAPGDMPPPVRAEEELDAHPLNRLFRIERSGPAVDSDPDWRRFRAGYYGLVAEMDHHLGRVFEALRDSGQWHRTVIVFCSDHGEYLGDHWMVEKELWHDTAYRTPLILRDPRREADTTRGTEVAALAESVDVLPTLLDAVGIAIPREMDGRSLLSVIHSGQEPSDWRTAVFADWDYRFYWTGEQLGIPPDRRRAWMVRTMEYKYWHVLDLPPVLFDLRNDPDELHNVAGDPACGTVMADLRTQLLEWRMSNEDERYVAETYRYRPHFGPSPFGVS